MCYVDIFVCCLVGKLHGVTGPTARASLFLSHRGRAMQCLGSLFLLDNRSCYCENRKGSRKAKVALYVTDALAGHISLAAQKQRA